MPKKLEQEGLLRVRRVDPAVLRQFKIQALQEGLTQGELFIKVFDRYLRSPSP
jgi:hypothetical protein